MTSLRLFDRYALQRNLRAGLRLATLRRTRADDFAIDVGQVFTLIAALFLWSLALDYVVTDPARAFSTWGFANYCVNYAAFIASLFLIARIQGDYAKVTALLVMQLAAMPVIAVLLALVAIGYDLDMLGDYAAWIVWAVILLYFIWTVVVCVRSIRLTFGVTARRAALHAGLFLAINWTAYSWFSDTDLWYTDDPDTWTELAGRINVEDTFYAQDALVEQATDALLDQEPGTTDLYFLGVAGYAFQDVFMKEVNFARDLFDNRFATRERSMLLINNRQTIADVPLANLHNLRNALAGIGARMDTDDDVLFLFMTSHGSKDFKLAVDFYPLQLNDIPAAALRTALDDSGIKWRVILVSACYSGGFIDALKDDHTLIMTAAANDKQSFGCGNDRDFTYFGETYLRDRLPETPSFIAAFDEAKAAIQQREKTEGLSPSDPQIFIGAEIEAKLAEFDRERRRRSTQLARTRTEDRASAH